MERNYETICIIKPDVGEEAVKGIITKASKTVTKDKGSVHNVDEWGRKRLAYPIKKNNEGYYVLLTYSATSEAARELERVLKLNEDVMRFQTVKLKEPEVKAVEAEVEAPEEAKVEVSEQAKGGADE